MSKRRLKPRWPQLALLLAVVLAAILPQKASAHDFEVDGIYYNIVDGGAEVTYQGSDYSSAFYEGEITIPSKVKFNGISYPVTSIGEKAFYGCSSLASVTISEGVTSIGAYAFEGCSRLSSVTIPEGVTSIGRSAFYRCDSLSSVTIPEGVTSIGSHAFNNCDSLASVTIPEGVTSIEEGTFSYCTSLASVTIPEGVTSIGQRAFYGCTSLASVTIPEGVTSIGSQAFEGCSRLVSVTIPVGVTSIGTHAFAGCTLLVFVTIPEGVTSIGAYAFEGCSRLVSVTIPEGVTSIGRCAFYNCTSLSSVTIHEGVTSIASFAFGGCSRLVSVTIPEGVTSIEEKAFWGCISLKEVTCYALTPCSLGSAAFYNTPSSKTLYVPEEAVEAYKESDWSSYFSTIEAIPVVGLTIEIEGNGKVYNNSVEVENGMKYEEGALTLYILADDGNQIASATLDGEDVKGQIVNHILTIENCEDAGVLKIVFAAIEEKEATLTVNGNEPLSLTLYYKEGTEAKIDLRPEEGWKLYSLSLNGEDVTNDVVGNQYVTPALSGDNHLEVVMKSATTTEIDQLEAAQRRVAFRKHGNSVEILNLEEGETISIFNAEGACEYQGKNHTVTLPANNVYILHTEKETLKFAL